MELFPKEIIIVWLLVWVTPPPLVSTFRKGATVQIWRAPKISLQTRQISFPGAQISFSGAQIRWYSEIRAAPEQLKSNRNSVDLSFGGRSKQTVDPPQNFWSDDHKMYHSQGAT